MSSTTKKKNKPSLIIQHNTIDQKSNRVVESNTKSEKEKKQDTSTSTTTTTDLSTTTTTTSTNIQQLQEAVIEETGEISSLSLFQKAYRYLGDWIYLTNFNFFCNLLRYGPIPKHIGVIMDGNRRFARKLHIETSEGHKLGFTKMLDLCQWGLALGVEIISVYAFSIENFKRPKQEVEYLMDLANKKFEEMISKTHKLQKMGIRIRVVGDLSYIPEKTKSILARAVLATQHNTRALLNVCMSYTSHNEMLHSMNTISNAVKDNVLLPEDINQELFEKCLYIPDDLDILVRTSGEYRLSDFMLWQTCFSGTNFLNVLWPDFSSFHFFYIIFLYQSNYQEIQKQRKKHLIDDNLKQEQIDRVKAFQNKLEQQHQEFLQEWANKHFD
ncbi:Dehydrodolichyl diphosphate synthase [Cavenderia fasciculata]|uniref:Alkyl transferase n=1 Tax=Cavenderia fasciculata TaxID=261658 RepID=F4Q307_CACFS|nr:Dehydrodolichyl diphosphate synthase [Cavenderia fasciculata]EGG17571.1 Dehydrodolichyl diphosphate synthase [Cavenderia fasciculata]|eukprot:XP_004356055.1 Dehydrodolichyl diphosphate synthase [Cavenderia fasciculata]